MSYTYTDREGDELSIQPDRVERQGAYVLSERGAFIRTADLPKIVAELYEAAGQEPPIILDRPKNADYSDRAKIHAGLIVEHGSGMVHLPGGSVSPRAARTIAALIVEMAEAAVAEMTNEAVKGLASLIYGESDLTEATAENIARVVIGAGYARSES